MYKIPTRGKNDEVKKMRRLIFVLTICLFSSANALTLKEAETLAVKNYPKLKALELQSKSLRTEAKSINLSRFGEVNLNSNLSDFNRNYMSVPMSHMPNPKNPPPFDSQTFSYGISYSMPLYLGGTISRRVKIAQLQSEILKNLKTATEWQIRYDVDTLYLNYLSLSNVEKALKDYKHSLLKLEKDVKAGIEVGKFAKVDLLKVEYSVEDVQSKIDTVKNRKSAIITAIETLIGRKVKTVEPVTVNYQAKNYSLEELYEALLRRNHILKAKEGEVRAASQRVRLEEGKYGPKVGVEATYTRNYGFDSGENEGYGKAVLNFQLPFFEFGRKKYDVLSAKLNELSEEKELETEKRELKKQLANAIADLNSFQSDIEALRKKLVLATEVERIEKLKYESGKGDMDHLLLAKSEKFITRANLDASYYSWDSALRRINALLEVER